VAAHLPNPVPPQEASVGWARLIPGEIPPERSWKKRPQPAGTGVFKFVEMWVQRRPRARWLQGAAQTGDPRNALVVGASEIGRRIAAYAEEHPESGRVVCGILDDDTPLGDGVIGRSSDLARVARTRFVDEIILAAPRDRKFALRILREARRLRLNVEIVPDLLGCRPISYEVERMGDLPLISLHSERLPAAGLLVKRIIDVCVAATALALLSPLLLLIMALIRLDSRGTVLYSALRAGRKGKPFRCLKFRTMVRGAEGLKNFLRQHNQRRGPFFKMVNDPRITRIGRLLRRYSLDELPQLWNVLRGEMSLVGPRPHPLDDLAGYEVKHLARLDVTPGMTGLWQVTARRDPSFEKGMELDRQYIQTWSLRSDLRILLQTVWAVARGSGD
jgi:exopolysaccharide biosynthesis polyprenyl glycosylphosphotransferase